MARRSDRYDNAIAGVREIVIAHDPIGLLALGALLDEYNAEVSDLVRLVLGRVELGEAEVDEVWARWFGETYRMAGTDTSRGITDELRALQVRLS